MDAKEIYLSKPWLKYYPNGVPAEVEIPEQSIPELFDEVTAEVFEEDRPHLLRQEDYLWGIDGSWWIDLPLHWRIWA